MLSSSVLSYPTKSVPITQTWNSTNYVQLWNTHVKACFLQKQKQKKKTTVNPWLFGFRLREMWFMHLFIRSIYDCKSEQT